MLSDAAVVRRVLAGDPDAFAILVDRHYARCARSARHLVGNREDAEEAVQDTFVRAYRALGDYEERDTFGAWLFRILVNQCRTVTARSARRAERFPAIGEALPEGFDLTSDAPPEEGALAERLDEALARLRPDQREAVVLHYAEELSYEEMATVTGAGVSALKMRVARGLARLRALLQEVHCV